MTITAVKAGRKMAAGRSLTVPNPPLLWDPSAAADASGTLPNAQTGQTWTYLNTWNTVSGAAQAAYVAGGQDHKALLNYGTKDGTFYLDVTCSPTGSGALGRVNAGLLIAGADFNNHLMVSFGRDSGPWLQLYKVIGGVATNLTTQNSGAGPPERYCISVPQASTPGMAIGSTHRIGIKKAGTALTLLYGGKAVDTATISAGDDAALGTGIGLRDYTSTTEDDGNTRFTRLVAE